MQTLGPPYAPSHYKGFELFLHLAGAGQVAHGQQLAAKRGVGLDLRRVADALTIEFHHHALAALLPE